MQLRTLFLAALCTIWLGTLPAFAAPTDQEKFEKKLARFAPPSALALDASKARGMCVCDPGDLKLAAGAAGVLLYEVVPILGGVIVTVTCEILAFDLAGAIEGSATCTNWTPLAR